MGHDSSNATEACIRGLRVWFRATQDTLFTQAIEDCKIDYSVIKARVMLFAGIGKQEPFSRMCIRQQEKRSTRL